MCFRTSGFVCACIFICVVCHCHCSNKQEHIHHHHEKHESLESFSAHSKERTDFFLHELFQRYGHNGVLTLKEFESMLESLAERNYKSLHSCDDSTPHQLIPHDHSSETQPQNHSSDDTKSSQLHDSDPKPQISVKPAEFSAASTETNGENITSKVTGSSNFLVSAVFENLRKGCFTSHDLIKKYNFSVQNDLITPSDFYQLCPAVVYQIHNLCTKEYSPDNLFDDHFDHGELSGIKVWLYASLSVLAISVCGFFSVALIPLIKKCCYHTLVQFLVALAVGSLSGDALLHLLPHSMATDEPNHGAAGSHNISIWRGFAGLVGIYLFFATERLLNHITSYRKVKQRTKVLQMPKFARSLTNVDGEQSKLVGEKLSHHKHGSYGYKFDPAAIESLENLNDSALEDKQLPDSEEKTVDHLESPNNSISKATSLNPDDSISQSNKGLNDSGDLDKNLPLKPLHVDATYLPSSNMQQPDTPDGCHRETVVYRHAHDDHSYVVTVNHHHHGHSHEQNSTISSVAWMVVMGDGLHNFCDGLAIGAAFVSGISGGISTSVAVLCHELPHELGDFAMLLKAGMSVKQALLYNSISSLLCLLGTLIGVSLGNIPTVTNWIFAGAAGMFLYIALVDMLPELTAVSGHSCESCFRQLVLQVLGISMGTVIMLVIALYEHDLQHLVS